MTGSGRLSTFVALAMLVATDFDVSSVLGASWYVSPEGVDSLQGGRGTSVETPFRTPQFAADQTRPGDTVYLMAGTYRNADFGKGNRNGAVLHLTRSGSASGGYITYTNYRDGVARLQYDGRAGIQGVGISYLKIANLEIEGPAAGITLSDARSHRTANPKSWKHNNEGIVFWLGGAHNDHITIENCHVHHACGTGITVQNCDNIDIVRNRVHDNCRWSSDGPSGINVFRPVDQDHDAATLDRILVRENTVYDNWCEIAAYFQDATWFASSGGQPNGYGGINFTAIVDGQGILVSQGDVSGPNNTVGYDFGRAIIENNVCCGNGMGGITYHDCRHGLIRNNSLFHNGRHPADSWNKGLILHNARDVCVVNNIVQVSTTSANYIQLFGTNTLQSLERDQIRVSHNCYWGAGEGHQSLGTDSRIADPIFVNAAQRDLRLRTGSPCIDSGKTVGPEGASARGRDGVARTAGKAPDRGAFEQ